MIKIVVDTCVWLDVAKDPNQQDILTIVEELVQMHEIELILPELILVEFARNKDRVISESKKSLSGVISRVKDTVTKFGDPEKKHSVIEQLNNLTYKIPVLNEAVNVSITRIEKLFAKATIVPATDKIKLKAVQRAIEKKAPLHCAKNSIDDAIIIETYAGLVLSKKTPGERFAFITHNTKDFSLTEGSDKLPHIDFAGYFSKRKSLFFIKLAEALQYFKPDLVSDILIEQEIDWEPRSLSEILSMENELTDKVWYNRHKYRAELIRQKKIKIIASKDFDVKTSQHTIVDEIWEGAKNSAKRVEKEYGKKGLLPDDDFEWGMINGKLSAIRWILGDEWDNLDT
jgi:hypothetical protein